MKNVLIAMFAVASAMCAAEVAEVKGAGDDVAKVELNYDVTVPSNVWEGVRMPSVQTNQCTPTIAWYVPRERKSDACLIVCPGGGYSRTAAAHEGYPVADYFASKGMTVALLRYRTPRPYDYEKHVTAWQDAQRTIRIVRSEAGKRGYSPDKIGMMGFSAGGHLTLMCATSSETPAYARIDALDDVPCNLNFAVPVYPAYLPDERNLSRKDRDLARRTGGEMKLVPEFKFDSHTPPMILIHGDADGYTPMGSVMIYRQLRTMGIPAEMHIYAKTGHGFGISKRLQSGMPAVTWPDRVFDWMKFMKFADEK